MFKFLGEYQSGPALVVFSQDCRFRERQSTCGDGGDVLKIESLPEVAHCPKSCVVCLKMPAAALYHYKQLDAAGRSIIGMEFYEYAFQN